MMVDPDSGTGVDLLTLLQGLADELPETLDIAVHGLCLDSRRIARGELFIALQGQRQDAGDFIEQAVASGAAAVLVEAGRRFAAEVPVIPVRRLRSKVGFIASRYYDCPSREMQVVGITGTNGKTSVCHFIAQALNSDTPAGAGCIGTLGYGIYPDLEAGPNTTPDAVTLQSLLAGFRRRSAHWTVMEVSSHALGQDRVNGTEFDIAVFTNLSHEHLDYHGDMQSYADAKARLFRGGNLQQAVINVDDDYGRRLRGELEGKVPVIGYGIDEVGGADPSTEEVGAVILDQNADGLRLAVTSPWGQGELNSRLIGSFNAYNLLAALAVLCRLGLPFETVLNNLSQLQPIPGRMEVFGHDGTARLIVDYAHTPDALEQALSRLKALCTGRLFCVFGCGGGRDTAKRGPMGRIAERYCDRVIVTSDNPRDEVPERIMADIVAGMSSDSEVLLEVDRTTAIRTALDESGPGDIVLIAGKGHETYQEIKGHRYPFSDRQLLRNLLGEGS